MFFQRGKGLRNLSVKFLNVDLLRTDIVIHLLMWSFILLLFGKKSNILISKQRELSFKWHDDAFRS